MINLKENPNRYSVEEQKQIAGTIWSQLGDNKFQMMTGAKNLVCGEKNGNVYITFKIGRNPAHVNFVTITLDWTDTYTMKFEKIRTNSKTFEITRKEIATREMVYDDMLQSVFTDITGLNTRL